MLMQIKQLLLEREQMTLTDLSRHFHVSEGVMGAMLAQWEKKGRITKIEQSGSCVSSCGSCSESSDTTWVYRWKKVAQKPIYTRAD